MNQPTIEQYRRESRSEWPFFVFVTLVLAIVYGIVVLQNSELRADPAKLILFTVLMAVQAALYWLPWLFPLSPGRGLGYLLVQAALAYAMIFMAASPFLTFGLIAPIIGLSLGMLPRYLAAILIVMLLVVSALVIVALQGWTSVSGWLFIALPMTLFIIIYVVLYGRQAEARTRAQRLLEELEDAHAELADYASQVEELTLAAERQRMARELHDTLAQGVAGLILQLEAVDAYLDSGDTQRAQTIVQQAMERARRTLADARRAIDDLRREQEGGRGLDQSVRDKIDRFASFTGILCHLDLDFPPTLPAALSEPAVRTITETLANVAKHAHASEVWVSIKVENQMLAVEVRDDGVGFDPAASLAAGHYGLQGIRERAELTGGSAQIVSQPGKGTTIRLRLPLSTSS